MNGASEQVKAGRFYSINYGWYVMGSIWAINLMIPFAILSLGVMLPAMSEELDITPLQAGILGATGFLGSALVALPASIWLSKYSPKKITLLCVFLSGITLLIHGWAPSFEILLVARFLFVITAVSRVQAEVLLMQQWFASKQIPLVISISIGVVSIGQMAAVGLTPHLMLLFSGWRNMYFGMGILLLICALLWMFIAREQVQANIMKSDISRMRSPINVLRRYKFLWVLAIAPSGAALAWGSVMTFWPTHALDSLGLSLTEVGMVMTMFPAGGIAASFLAGPLSDLIGRRKPFLWVPGILLPPLYIALFITKLPILAGILLLVAGWNAMIWVPIMRTIPFDLRLAPRETAVATGLSMTLIPIVGAMGPLLVGAIQQITGSLQIGLLSIVVFPLTLLVGGLLIPETGSRRVIRDFATREEKLVT